MPKTEELTEGPPVSTSKEARLLRALRQNPSYYFRQVLKIETKAGTLEHFNPKREQRIVINIITALRECDIPVRLVILKARQIGMSTMCAGVLFHATSLWPHRHSKVIAHDADTTEMLYDKSRMMYNQLPDEPLLKPKTEKYGKKGLVFSAPLYSKMTVQTAGTGTVGTGQTVHYAHLSEVAKWENPGTVATSFMQAVPRPSVNPNTMIIMESTAEGYGNYFHEMYLTGKRDKEQLLADMRKVWEDKDKLVELFSSYPRTIGWLSIFFPWHEFDEYSDPVPDEKWFRGSLTPEELKLKAKYHLTFGQLQFRRAKIEELAKDERGIPPEELFKQEYPFTDEEAFIVTGTTEFSQKALAEMKPDPLLFRGNLTDQMKKMIDGEPRDLTWDEWRVEHLDENDKPTLPRQEDIYGPLKVYEWPQEGEQYAVGVDVAIGERETSDLSVIQVINKRTGNQCAVWRGTVHPEILGKYAIQLAGFYNEAILGPENNSFGVSTVRTIQNSLYPYPYIKNSANYKVITEAPTEEWGWNTNAQTKPMIISNMAQLIADRLVKFNDEITIGEARIFRREGKKLEAPQGKHDDTVMAMAIALWIMTEHPYQREIRPDAVPMADKREMERAAELQSETWEPEPDAYVSVNS